MNIFNQSRIDYKLKPLPSSFFIDKTVFSNEAMTVITYSIINAELESDKSEVEIYEVFTLKVKITNLTAIPLYNILLKTVLFPKQIVFVPNSTMINSENKFCYNPLKGFCIPLINPYSSIVVRFSFIAGQYSPSILNSQIGLDFFYTDNPLISPMLIHINSNRQPINIINTLFLQTQITNTISIPPKYPKAYGINSISSVPSLISCRMFPSPSICSRSSNKNSAFLLIISKMRYTVGYQFVPLDNNSKTVWKSDSQLSFDKTFGFSSTITVPVGMQYSLPSQISYDIEHITYELVGNKIMCNTFLLVKISD